MIVKPWFPDESLEKQDMDSAPVWIQLPDLPQRMWTSKILSKISSYIGKPLAVDKLTGHRTRLGFARLLIDVKKGIELPDMVAIHGPNGIIFNQRVMYESKMKHCAKCNRLGHEAVDCRTKQPEKKNEQQKQPITVVEEKAKAAVVETVVTQQQQLASGSNMQAVSQKLPAIINNVQAKVQAPSKLKGSNKGGGNSSAEKGVKVASGSHGPPKPVGRGRGINLDLPNG